MHVNEQLIRESSARLRKAERNVQLARQFSCMHPRAIVASAAKESFGKKLARAVKARTALRATTRKQHEEQAQSTASQNDASAPRAIDASRRKNGARLR